MKVLCISILILIIAFFKIDSSWAVTGQTQQNVSMQVNEICLVKVSGNPSVLSIDSAVAGAIPDPDTDNSTYLYYTSTVSGAQTRKITATLGPGDQAPVGTSLKLQAESVPAQCGSGQPVITLTTSSQEIVNTIGSCYTGSSGSNGVRLKYDFVVDSVTALDAGDDRVVTITFTLTDN